jgi:hypothetical protein
MLLRTCVLLSIIIGKITLKVLIGVWHLNSFLKIFIYLLFADPKARFIPSTIAFPLSAENVELKHALVGHAIKEAGLSEQQLPSENTFENLPVFAYVKKSAELQQIHESERWAVQFETAKDDELRVRVSSTSSVVVTNLLVS